MEKVWIIILIGYQQIYKNKIGQYYQIFYHLILEHLDKSKNYLQEIYKKGFKHILNLKDDKSIMY